MDYQHLSTLLWREQELLDLLLFKAEEKQYLILTGKTRWLARIAHEIEVVLDQLRTLEVERAAATEAIAVRLGVGANPSLRQLADAAPAPWNDLLAKHHEALLVLVTDLRSLSDANRELIEGGLAAIGDALLSGAHPVGRHLRRHRPQHRRRLAPRRHPGRRTVSTFSALNAATTALWAQRRALDVTGQNIANVNTEGYSRQRADLQAIGGSPVPAFYSTSPGIGAGVSAEGVTAHPRRLPRGPRPRRARQHRPPVRRGRRLHAGRGGLPRAGGHRHPEPHGRDVERRGATSTTARTSSPTRGAGPGVACRRWSAGCSSATPPWARSGSRPGRTCRPGLRRQRGRRVGRQAEPGDPARHPVGPPGQRPDRPAGPADHEARRPGGRDGPPRR